MSTLSTHKSRRTNRGFTSIELLVAVTVTLLGISLASSLLLAGQGHIRQQERELEATHAGRAAIETILRELRLGGACLPETGEFIALEAADNATADTLTTRYGLTTPNDMSCVQTTVSASIPSGAMAIPVQDTTDFNVGTLVYLRHTNGGGEYFKVTSVDAGADVLGTDVPLGASYPATSGVYAIDERRFYLDTTPATPVMMFQVNRAPAQPFALGIEGLDFEYQLSDGTLVDAPANDQEWRSVRQIRVSVDARSTLRSKSGAFYRRSFDVTIKPRNLVDS